MSLEFNVKQKLYETAYQKEGAGSLWVDKWGEVWILAQVMATSLHKDREVWANESLALFAFISLNGGNRWNEPVPWKILERTQMPRFKRIYGPVTIHHQPLTFDETGEVAHTQSTPGSNSPQENTVEELSQE